MIELNLHAISSFSLSACHAIMTEPLSVACPQPFFAGVLEYAGPPNLESVLAWAKAVDEWDGSDKIPVGWEVGKRADTVAADHETEGGGAAAGSKAKVKDEV